jgi:hypothetical protein
MEQLCVLGHAINGLSGNGLQRPCWDLGGSLTPCDTAPREHILISVP